MASRPSVRRNLANLNDGKRNAYGQPIAPDNVAHALRFAAFGQQEKEALRQLTLAFELETGATRGNVDDRARARLICALDKDAGRVMELPARLFAQFSVRAIITDDDHPRALACRKCQQTEKPVKRKKSTLRTRKLVHARSTRFDAEWLAPDLDKCP
jgi:hypothetical protein